MTIHPFDQKCFYTVGEFAALPEDNSMRHELIDGCIVSSPRPTMRHMFVIDRLHAQIDAQLSDDVLLAVTEIDLDLELSTPVVRIPDLVIVHPSAAREGCLAKASDAVLAVEVISPGSVWTDTRVKPLQYAEAGIPHLWLVDPVRPVTATVYRLADGEYQESQRTEQELWVDEPCQLRIDLDALLPAAFE